MEKPKLLLGITGAISISNIIDYILYFQEFFEIYIIMTNDATKLIPLSHIKYYCNETYYDEVFQDNEVLHINLASKADVLLVLPCTANTINKIAGGIADNLLTLTCLTFNNKLYLAPSMNQSMWENSILQDNINYLKKKGHIFLNQRNLSYEVATKKICYSDATLPPPKEILKIILKNNNLIYNKLKERLENQTDVQDYI